MQYYTDEMIAENFNALSKFNGDVLDVLGSLATVAERTDARLKSLENIELVVKAPRRSKLFLITLIGVSVYAGYKLSEREFQKTRSAYSDVSPYRTQNHSTTTEDTNPEK